METKIHPFAITSTILFTGAGFTYNFGGLLARTMWSEIHNRIQKYDVPNIVKVLKRNCDYEEIYNIILNGTSFTEREKLAIIDAVYEAYESLDSIIRYYNTRDIKTTTVDTSLLSKFILRFAGENKERGYFFTLNQDIFIERYFNGSGMDAPRCPGIKIQNNLRFSGWDKRGKELEKEDLGRVPTAVELEKHKTDLFNVSRLFYMKLHGSFDWRDASNERKLIIGTNKVEDIQKEPILKWYFQEFKNVLSRNNCRTLIIGYGFRDSHINAVLLKSVKSNGLKLYIVCPIDPMEFYVNTLSVFGEDRDLIWDNVGGYYPYNLAEIFPKELPPSTHLKNLCNDLFGI